jgi:hypothetical protein
MVWFLEGSVPGRPRRRPGGVFHRAPGSLRGLFSRTARQAQKRWPGHITLNTFRETRDCRSVISVLQYPYNAFVLQNGLPWFVDKFLKSYNPAPCPFLLSTIRTPLP